MCTRKGRGTSSCSLTRGASSGQLDEHKAPHPDWYLRWYLNSVSTQISAKICCSDFVDISDRPKSRARWLAILCGQKHEGDVDGYSTCTSDGKTPSGNGIISKGLR